MEKQEYPALAAIRTLPPEEQVEELSTAAASTQQPLQVLSMENGKSSFGKEAMLRFYGRIGRCDAKILVDSGATYSFISASFVNKHRLRTSPIDGPTIQLADGTLYLCKDSLPAGHLKIGPYQTKFEAYVLPLQGNDVILGSTWLNLCNPQIDWREQSMTIHQYGQEIVLRPNIQTLPEGNRPLTALEAMQELRHGATGYLAFARAMPQQAPKCSPPEHQGSKNPVDPDSQNHQNPPEPHVERDSAAGEGRPPPSHALKEKIERLLKNIKEKYASVMPEELPDGLPPSRSVDHEIKLEPGFTPPNQKYYRMSYALWLQYLARGRGFDPLYRPRAV
jgi:hypothetical protein